jgi:tetratricopeptide (TPR) repeat protein
VKLSNARRAVVGAATALAALGSAIVGYTSAEDELIGAIGGLAGGTAVFVASILLARADQRQAERQQALAARDSVLKMLPLPISLSGPPAVSDASAAVLTTRAPSQLLVADRQAIGRPWGRSRDLARLQAWVQSPHSPTLGILTGPAGVGKTRLTIQLATSLKGSWVTGRLKSAALGAIGAIIACSEPTLVVIEANGWQSEITAILDELAELDTANSYPVKLLLVSRRSDWLTYLRSKVRADTAGLIDAAKLLPLDQVGGPEDLLRWYGEARVTFADLLGQPAPPKTGHGPPTGTTFGDLLALAYASVVTSDTGAALSTAGEVADVLAEQERRQWPEPDVAITDELRVRIVAALILRGGVDDPEEAASVIARIPELSDTSAERLRDLTRWAGRIYPGRNWFSMPSLDLLTHGLAVPALRDQTLRKSLTSDLGILTLARVSSFLIGAASTYPEAQDWITDVLHPSDLAESLTGLMFGSGSVPAPPQDRTDQLLAALIPKITEQTTLDELASVLSDAIGYPRARIALLQAFVAVFRALQNESAARPADLARTLTALGSALNDVGRYDEVVTADKEAVALFRKLAEEHAARYQPDLAYVLSNLGNALTELGRYDEAVTVEQEALSLLRRLAKEDARHQLDLARVLSGLGRGLTEMGRSDEAITVVQEAVSLLRRLAQEDAQYQLNLARALGNLGNALTGLGRYDEAVTVEQEALSLFRRLAHEDARHQLNLTRTMLNVGNALAEAGRYDEAVAAEREAVSLLRKLAEEYPARYQPDLARTLTTLGSMLNEVGRHEEALTFAQEAVSLLRRLAQEDSARHQLDLARTLSNLGIGLTRVDRYDEAVTVHQEAVTLLRKLAKAHPARHQSDLARALQNLGAAFGIVGRYDDALTVDQEAVSLFRNLAAERPAYQQDFAGALSNLGNALTTVGRHDDALTAYKESHALFKALASDQPWHDSDVAMLERKVRKLLRELGREEESVKFAL